MKRIELKSLHLKNFKGIKNLEIDCQSKVVNIAGDNATGKTTVNDAFRWLLFDKDSTDRKQFEIKTLDKNNEPIHNLEHTVVGEIYVDSNLVTLQKTYKERWTKKRGDVDATFTGHETLYSIDDVPVKKSEYENEIAAIVDEIIFKLITNPLYFSSIMSWQDRRKILLDFVGEPDVAEVVDKNKALSVLEELLNEKDIDQLRGSISAKRKKLNDELKQIPARIDENNNAIIEVNEEQVKKELEEKKAELKKADNQLTNATGEDPGLAEKKQQLNDVRSKITAIENSVSDERIKTSRTLSQKLRDAESRRDEKTSMLRESKSKLDRLNERAVAAENEINQCRKDWDAEKAKEFQLTEDFTCPTCKRKLDENVIEKKKAVLEENFNQKKAQNLEQHKKDGQAALTRKSSIEDQIDEEAKTLHNLTIQLTKLDEDIEVAKKEIADFEDTDPEYPDEYEQLKSQAEQIAGELTTPEDTQSRITALKSTKENLIDEIDDLKTILQKVDSNKQLRTRIKELSKREREVSQQIADLEKQEFLCEKFIKTKVELLDQKINSMFSFVRFKLFDEQINGGLTETCEALVDGVPFSDANNAAKINAGIDIINTLSKHYQVTAPIVIDNRESINEIIPTEAQVINLIVSKDPVLKVETVNEKVAEVA